ncbi:MAG TPA: hypothetical protein VN903_27095 [Polyangia bacterium]|nr:hypothetical protein [Polyangia bacterium]
MNEIATSGPRKSLLATLALVALAAGPARAQTNDEKPAGAPEAQPAAPPPPPVAAPPPPPALIPAMPPPPAAPAPEPAKKKRSAEEIPAPAEIATAATPGAAGFARRALKATLGEASNAWSVTLFGAVQADYIADTTRSYDEYLGPVLVARTDTYEGSVGRTQFTARSTRFGLVLESPSIGGVTPSAAFLSDFAGNQPGTPYPNNANANEMSTGNGLSEINYYNSPTLRIRYAYLTLRSRVLDVVAGETVDVFGWQSFYSLCSLSWVPNQITSRNPQFRISKSFGVGGPISLDVALEAARPAQRDSQIPDAMGAIRLSVNKWKGVTTPGNSVTIASPLSLSVSGVSREFKVNAFTPPPTQTSNSTVGWGISADLFLPIVPAADADDRSNKLTLIGSFVYGTGIADLMVAGGGAKFPTLPNPAQWNPPPKYSPDVDNGLVTFDSTGVLHSIDWWTAKVGLQYYLPARFILSLNATYAHSNNIAKLFPRGGAEIELLGSIANTTMYGEATVLWDATAAVRFGVSGQYTRVRYLDGNEPYNIRGIGQAIYVF